MKRKASGDIIAEAGATNLNEAIEALAVYERHNMTGTIVKVDTAKQGGNYPTNFIRVWFKMEDGTRKKCDVCPAYNNFHRWKFVLKVGTILSGLSVMDDDNFTIDGDSKIKFEGRAMITEQMDLF